MSTKTKKTSETEVPMCTDFKEFAKPVKARFEEMSKGELFVTDCGDGIFDAYLQAFPEGTNPVLRQRTVHDCVCCKQFIRRLGKLVAIKDGKVTTVWGGLKLPEPYKTVADKMDELVRCARVTNVFRTKEKAYGTSHNYDSKTNERYDHFHGEVASRHYATDPDAKRGEQDTIFLVMRRGLTEIRDEDLESVLDLIESNGIYRGEEHKDAVKGFMSLKAAWTAGGKSELFVWENLGHRYARFRNTVIGSLLVELAEGKDLDAAVKSFETKVAPANYKRPTSVITQKMVEQAVQTLTDLGLHGAIARRYAKLSDVSVNDVLFVDNDAKGKMKDGISALLEGSVVKHRKFDVDNATPVAADAFVRDVLPGAKTLDVFLENRHAGNFVSLTGADGPERLFKWDNNFAWSYDGDVADSVKQRVKAAGGKIDCKLRVSLSWFNTDDLDLHVQTPDGAHVYYGDKRGILDVDMNAHTVTRNPVENLAFNTLKDGWYKVWVNQFNRRETTDFGFAIEIEYGGHLRQYSYAKAMKNKEDVQCFRLRVHKGELVEVATDLVGGASSQEKWGVKTQELVPVQLVCHSPNHWGDNAAGAKHLIFALKGCKNPDTTRGIYNEFLRGDLDKHRKVFEVLGNKTKCPKSDEQVSGVGFTAARGDTVTVVVDGKRAYTLTF